MRMAIAALLAPLVLTSPALTSENDCGRRLDQITRVLSDGAVLKEELATGIMWMRLDAAEHLKLGDEEECIAITQTIEMLVANSADSDR